MIRVVGSLAIGCLLAAVWGQDNGGDLPGPLDERGGGGFLAVPTTDQPCIGDVFKWNCTYKYARVRPPIFSGVTARNSPVLTRKLCYIPFWNCITAEVVKGTG